MKEVAKRIIERLEQKRARSAWNEGVRKYALRMMRDYYEELLNFNPKLPIEEKTFLNGATTWSKASYSASYLVCGEDIAKMLCTKTELKKTRNGELPPNSHETWLDTQARALFQAWKLIKETSQQVG